MRIDQKQLKVRDLISHTSLLIEKTSQKEPNIIQVSIISKLILLTMEPNKNDNEKKLERSILRLYFAVKGHSDFITLHQDAVIENCREVIKLWLV
ncbi:hypothetical protein QF117_11275 [Vibrio sp. YMD68]|uniref:hypothetical protein n=1 Tax=Vibrio sp. YMD68 TaxID=3042300 RepID=UPI00249BF472|nr:hypothetical protein [Vibrio sp. YMD68]WGW01363.1 hypothetical protein QF117_11275 [Vibrio sp. YMD68]